METIKLLDNEYEVVENFKEALDKEVLTEKYTEFFQDYDYVVGDWAYGKLRLKGFCEKDNKLYKAFNDKDEIKN